MAYYTKADLVYNYYWNARQEGDNPNLVGHPDRDLIDRNEGYEVLYFINRFAIQFNWRPDNKVAGRKLEKMLRDVPGNLRSRTNITNWISANWNKY